MLNVIFASVFVGFVVSAGAAAVAEQSGRPDAFFLLVVVFFCCRYVYAYALHIDVISALDAGHDAITRRPGRELIILMTTALAALASVVAIKQAGRLPYFIMYLGVASLFELIGLVLVECTYPRLRIGDQDIAEVRRTIATIASLECILAAVVLVLIHVPSGFKQDAIDHLVGADVPWYPGYRPIAMQAADVDLKVSQGIFVLLAIVFLFGVINRLLRMGEMRGNDAV